MLRFVTVLACCVAYLLAETTTHHPHHTGTGVHHSHSPKPSLEPVEHENFRFVYEPHHHKMLLVTGHECYVFNLSEDEMVAVHTDAGIRAIELKLLSSLSTATMTTMTKAQLDHATVAACGAHVTAYHVQS